jgi:hypothetical protein
MEIIGAINVDMLGWDGNDDGVTLINVREIGSSVEMANKAMALNSDYSINLSPQIIMPGSGSDNLAFWHYGIGSIGIEEHYGGDWNPFYHTSFDNISQFNISYFVKNAKLAVGVLADCSNLIDNTLTIDELDFQIEQTSMKNFPNPFNSNTTISYFIPKSSKVTIIIYDLLGRKINVIADRYYEAGYGSVKWNGKDTKGNSVNAGLYICKLIADEYQHTMKMVLLK